MISDPEIYSMFLYFNTKIKQNPLIFINGLFLNLFLKNYSIQRTSKKKHNQNPLLFRTIQPLGDNNLKPPVFSGRPIKIYGLIGRDSGWVIFL